MKTKEIQCKCGKYFETEKERKKHINILAKRFNSKAHSALKVRIRSTKLAQLMPELRMADEEGMKIAAV